MPGKYAVIGLGHFGMQLAMELAEKGAEVIAIDIDMDKLEDIKDHVTYTVKLDSREEKALRNQGLTELDAVIVGIGDDFEATLLTVAMLQQIGVKRIIARATTPVHEQILLHLGLEEVVLPARETAHRLANSLMFRGVMDSFVVSSDYSIVEINAPGWTIGKTVSELDLRKNFELSLITIKRPETRPLPLGLGTRKIETILGVPSPITTIQKEDNFVVFGTKKAIQHFLEYETETV